MRERRQCGWANSMASLQGTAYAADVTCTFQRLPVTDRVWAWVNRTQEQVDVPHSVTGCRTLTV